MNKKILISLSVIAAVAAIAIGGTIAYFSDTETSVGNTLTAGIIDILVDGQNPWEITFEEKLLDMKPCQTRYIEFTVENSQDSNPIELWKHINITSQTDGYITEPECEEGGGTWSGGSVLCTDPGDCCSNYTARNNLAAYTIYDMYVCADPDTGQECLTDDDGKPYGSDWRPIITEEQNVRLDNIDSIWIHLAHLQPTDKLKVVQSYHLRSWPDAPEEEVTNWAQGDEMTFDIELMATQEDGPGPKGYLATLNMVGKNPITWEPIPGANGVLTYNTEGSIFDYNFSGTGLENIEYCLIYYADPWPGDGQNHLTGDLINKGTAADSNLVLSASYDFGHDLPHSDDANAPAGAKIWLVPCADYNEANHKMTGWSPSTYLFEENLIQYTDTDI